MSETQIIVEETASPLVVEIIDETVEVVADSIQEKTVEILSGAKGVTTQWLLGALSPQPSDGTIGDIWLVTQGLNAGDVYKKMSNGLWEPNGSIRGAGYGITDINGDLGPVVVLTKEDVGLANVDNTSDANKPVSTAQQTAIDLKANIASPTFTGTVGGITKAMVGLGNVDNTTDALKPISTATQSALDLKVNTTGAETIAGVKTFSSAPVVPDSSFAIIKVSGLQAALDSKEAVIVAGTTAQYRRGDNSWQTLNLVTVDLTTAQTVAGVKTFSSSPIVPTPTISTQAANKGYVDSIVDAAPGTLDTLNELAAALGDDPNFATTVANSIALKAPIDSPTFTGTVSGITKAMVGLSNVANAAQVELAGTQTITGAKSFSSIIAANAGVAATTLSASGAATVASSIELGRVDGTANTPFIDFHANATAQDYDARIIASAGGGSNGQGTLTYNAATHTFSGTIGGNGSLLTSLNGTNISSGTVADARLSSNVVLLTGDQTLSGLKTFSALITASAGVTVTGTVTATLFSGSGASLTALNGTNISTGTVAIPRLPAENVYRVVHNGTSWPARPTGATCVEWLGPVVPTAATANDTWTNSSL